MMEATFGRTDVCDTENGFVAYGCATETLDDVDRVSYPVVDCLPSLDLDANMFAYFAAIEFLFDDADLPDVDASRLYKDRAEESKSERKDLDADVDADADADVLARGLKYFCAFGDSERMECEVVIGTYLDFCAVVAVREDSFEPVAAMLEDDKDFSVSSLASFNSFSASTSMSIEEEVEVDALRVEAIGFFSSASCSTSSASKSSPFTVFPDLKEDFKSSKDGSSSARASSAVFTAAERSRSPPLVAAEEEVAEEAAALFVEKYASNASLSEMLSSDTLRALNSSALRAIFASAAASPFAGAVAPIVEEEAEESAFDDGESNEKYPSSFFIVSSVSRSSFSLSESPSDKSIIFEEEEEVVEPNSPEEEDAASFCDTTTGGFGGKGKTSPSFAVFLFSSLLLLLSLLMVFLRLLFVFASIVDAFAEEEDVLDDAKPRAVDASLPGEALEDEERDDFDALFFASTPTNAEEQHPAIPATTASLSAAFAEVLLFVELVFLFISRSNKHTPRKFFVAVFPHKREKKFKMRCLGFQDKKCENPKQKKLL
jgi:hypothetical protein